MADIHELPIFSEHGGIANLGAIGDAALAKLTPERRASFLLLRDAQKAAIAADAEAVDALKNVSECEQLRDQMLREKSKYFPPQDRIAALREVQQTTMKRSRGFVGG
jgi:hypothetical protein